MDFSILLVLGTLKPSWKSLQFRLQLAHEFLQLQCLAHVPWDLHLACHEGCGWLQGPWEHLEEVVGIHGEGGIRSGWGVTLPTCTTAILQVNEPFPSLIPSDLKGINSLGLVYQVSAEEPFYLGKYLGTQRTGVTKNGTVWNVQDTTVGNVHLWRLQSGKTPAADRNPLLRGCNSW